MNTLPIVWLREYRVMPNGAVRPLQVHGPGTFDFPVTFVSYIAARGSTSPFISMPSEWTQLLTSTGDTGTSYEIRAHYYYAEDGKPPDMDITVVPIVFVPTVWSIVQFAVLGKATFTNVNATAANYTALTIPGSFTGERFALGLHSTYYESTRVFRNDEARYIDVQQSTDFPLWNASSLSDFDVLARSFTDYWWDVLIGTDRYAGTYSVATVAKVRAGDVVNLGAFSNVNTAGQAWDAWLIDTDGFDYDPSTVTKSFQRFGVNVERSIQSLTDSVTVNPVDDGVREQTIIETERSTTALNLVQEALTPSEPTAGYQALPEQSSDFVREYAGETILSRMTRAYPPAVIGAAGDLFDKTLPTYTVGTSEYATAQEVLIGLFRLWARTYPWFSARAVPDLRLLVVDPPSGTLAVATPAAYRADATLGRAGLPALFYQQDKDTRVTMRQMLDDLLSAFPGTIVRATPGNELEIVTTYGPDAVVDSVVTLTNNDAYQVTRGRPSPLGIINSCTVVSNPYVVTNDAGTMVPSFFRLQSNIYTGSATTPSAPAGTWTDLTNDNPTAPKPLYGWKPAAWTEQADVIADGEIKLKDSSNVVQVQIKWYAQDTGTSGTHVPAAADVQNIPVDGTTVRAISTRILVSTLPQNSTMYLRINLDGRYDAATRSVQFTPAGVNNFEPVNNFGFAANPCSVVVILEDATNAWQQGTVTITGTYNQDVIDEEYGDLGGALVESTAAYGERSATITINGYGVEDVNLVQSIARSYVLQAIGPSLVRRVDQSAWRAFPVRAHHVGSVVTLPDGTQGRVVSRSYTDAFGTDFGEGVIESVIEVEVADSAGAGYIDVTKQYLAMDDGTFMLLDDGSLAEVA